MEVQGTCRTASTNTALASAETTSSRATTAGGTVTPSNVSMANDNVTPASRETPRTKIHDGTVGDEALLTNTNEAVHPVTRIGERTAGHGLRYEHRHHSNSADADTQKPVDTHRDDDSPDTAHRREPNAKKDPDGLAAEEDGDVDELGEPRGGDGECRDTPKHYERRGKHA
ncbi:unnamed protein product [Phytophthora fragariaefolia]|uniref:Unnamed protein product n=1 Tax=Phytophthora fragariaefolia TaxID=1490495 RepID=A0A9W6X4G5_9STRA|nr:unnamed protein product [Phytophthora fragariaefolia]